MNACNMVSIAVSQYGQMLLKVKPIFHSFLFVTTLECKSINWIYFVYALTGPFLIFWKAVSIVCKGISWFNSLLHLI